MGIIQIILVLIVIGVLLYLVNTYIPMVAWMKTVINAVVAILTLVWLLQVFGVMSGFHLSHY